VRFKNDELPEITKNIRLVDLDADELRAVDLSTVRNVDLQRFLNETHGTTWKVLRDKTRSELAELARIEIDKLSKAEVAQ